jgi:NRPS condensation-like uncharacterized protein
MRDPSTGYGKTHRQITDNRGGILSIPASNLSPCPDDPHGRSSPCPPAGQLPRLPFTVIDEAVHVLDTPAEPWSIQFELRVAGHLDEARLRAAIAEALARHPMARARMVPPRPSGRRYYWEIPPEPELDPLRVLDCSDDDALSAIRSELQRLSVPLAESPPLRARLVRHPDGDLLMLNVNHAAFDGFGCVRFLHSVARGYAGQPDPLPQVPLKDARDVRGHLVADDLAARAPRWRILADKLVDLVVPPARLAPDEGADCPGYGFHHLRLSAADTAALSDSELPGTVNDLLVAALHLAVASWNAEHGAPCDRIGVLVPVNLRPDAWRQDVVTNFVLNTRVVTRPQDRTTPRHVLDTAVAQGARVRGNAGAALIEILRYTPLLPLWVKQQLPALLRLTGNRLVDTAQLSNLGLISEPPSFGPDAGETVELWFSAPARMPCGLSLGAATVGGCLHLAFRYRHPLFGPDATRRFADRYLSELSRLRDQANR